MTSTVERYRVEGMTCGHCVQAVTGAVAALAGVESVDVDLATGDVTVRAAAPLARDEVATAVSEAGYALATAPPHSP